MKIGDIQYGPTFDLDDIVETDVLDGLYIVTGVIHDEQRLFVSDYYRNNSEVEIRFSDVLEHWTKVS